jgi:hypothetical protein
MAKNISQSITEQFSLGLTYNNLPPGVSSFSPPFAVNHMVSQKICDMSVFTGTFTNRREKTRG